MRNILPHPGRLKQKGGINHNTLDKILMGFVALFDFIRLSALLIVPRLGHLFLLSSEEKESYSFIKKSDVIFIKGGGFLHTYGNLHDFYYIWYQSFYITLGVRLKKKVIILPNSFGPISRGLNRSYLRYILSKVHLVYARESESYDYLRHLFKIKNLYLAPDMAYFMDHNESLVKSNISPHKTIAITVRPYRFPKSKNPIEKFNSYCHEMAEFVMALIERSYKVSFVIQVKGPSSHENDLLAVKKILRLIDENVREDIEVLGEDGDCEDLVEIYKRFDIVVGTRFHSVIFKHLSGGKAIAIAYGGNKSVGIMRMLGLEKYVANIYTVTAEHLLTLVETLELDQNYVPQIKNSISLFLNERNRMLEKCRLVIGEV